MLAISLFFFPCALFVLLMAFRSLVQFVFELSRPAEMLSLRPRDLVGFPIGISCLCLGLPTFPITLFWPGSGNALQRKRREILPTMLIRLAIICIPIMVLISPFAAVLADQAAARHGYLICGYPPHLTRYLPMRWGLPGTPCFR